ncbi:signal peptidase I [Pseudonocardia sp.]|uniref:signal peptidase I n=1 Tax=Pseudonocardia sp. TaxID=60912 RepID=UPI0026173D96|nr:signal peptidase I [Pseudonocardia sp.]
MALPELPDRRRAQPRRITAGGATRDDRAARNGVAEAEQREPGRHALGPARTDAPHGPAVAYGRGVPVGPASGGRTAANGHTPTNGHAPPGSRPPTNGHAAPDGRAAPTGRAVPDGRAATNGYAGPVSRARTDAPPATNGRGVPARNGQAGPRALPRTNGTPARRAPVPRIPAGPDPDDEPTEVHDPIDGTALDAPAPAAAAPPEVPGRHRRRAGQSPQSRPAAEYKAQAEAARNGRKVRPGRRRRENFWRELPLLIVVALLMTFLIQTFLAKVYVIPSGSMETTLHGCVGCNNDRVLVDKVTYRFADPSPGDVVVFRGPDSWTNTEFSAPDTADNALVDVVQQFGSLVGLAPPDEKDFVKRVIAVGGQTVQCCDSRNRILVDGEPLDEPYIYFVEGSGNRQEPFDPVTVPAGQLWMMGDSRRNSADSTAPGHGPVPVTNVIGQARLIVLPFTRFGWIPSIDPHPDVAVGLAGDVGVPLAMGLLGTPLLLTWRRRSRRDDEFLP